MQGDGLLIRIPQPQNRTLNSPKNQNSSGQQSETQGIVGGHVALGVSYAINEEIEVYSRVRYQAFTSIELEANGSRAELDSSSLLGIDTGLSYRF